MTYKQYLIVLICMFMHLVPFKDRVERFNMFSLINRVDSLWNSRTANDILEAHTYPLPYTHTRTTMPFSASCEQWEINEQLMSIARHSANWSCVFNWFAYLSLFLLDWHCYYPVHPVLLLPSTLESRLPPSPMRFMCCIVYDSFIAS